MPKEILKPISVEDMINEFLEKIRNNKELNKPAKIKPLNPEELNKRELKRLIRRYELFIKYIDRIIDNTIRGKCSYESSVTYESKNTYLSTTKPHSLSEVYIQNK